MRWLPAVHGKVHPAAKLASTGPISASSITVRTWELLATGAGVSVDEVYLPYSHCAGSVDWVHGHHLLHSCSAHEIGCVCRCLWARPTAAAFTLHPGRTFSTFPPVALKTWWLLRAQDLTKRFDVCSTLAAAGYPVQCVVVPASLVWICSQPLKQV